MFFKEPPKYPKPDNPPKPQILSKNNLDKIVDCLDCISYEESGVIEESVFKKIFLAEPLPVDFSTILHDNLWNLYEEEKDITLTFPKASDDISWDVTLGPIEYDSEETKEIIENLNLNKIRVVGQERILKTGYNEYTSMIDRSNRIDEDKLTEKTVEI
jgi:hypothetical protein